MKIYAYQAGVLIRSIILLSCTVVFALLSTIRIASAQAPGNVNGKAPKRAIEELVSGNPQDLIVVFNNKVAQKSAEELQSQEGLTSLHSRIIKHKATKYADMKQKVLSAFAAHESTELKSYRNLPIGFLRVHSKETLDRLLANPDVVGVYENRRERLHLAQSLPLIGQSHTASQGNLGSGMAVAVLDTGVDYTHPAFGSCTSPGVPASCKVAYAKDFAPGNAGNHGTNVAGIILGVAPGAKIIDLKVFGAETANSTDILDAIDWVINNKTTYNIVAMNLSLGSEKHTLPVTSGEYYAAVNEARAAGILMIASSGNDGYTNSLASPAAVQGVVSVGAIYDSSMGTFNLDSPRCTDITSADKVTCFSNGASFLTLLAPGAMITSAGITMGGTSQAAPHVAGAVAVLRAAYPGETLDQTVVRLTNGVMVTDNRNDIIKPRLNLQMALGLNASCTYSISETSKSFSSISSSGSIAVTTSAGCTWSAASNISDSDWITVTSGSNGIGNGFANYSLSANDNIASRTGTITVAGMTYTIMQSGSIGTVSNILLNPGFENGPVSWAESTANEYPVITSYLEPIASNSWYAWLCGYNNCKDNLYQDVTLPANAQSTYVQFKYWITTDEKYGTTEYDSMAVKIYSPPNATTYTYWKLSNLNATTGWVLSPKYDVSAFKGQSIRLQFSAATDSSFPTNFYLDDVTLMVSGTTPDTQSPTIPTGLTATVSSSSVISLAWSASTDDVKVTAYKIFREGSLFKSLGNVTSYTNTGLTAGTTYSYTVSACDAAGNCSAQSLATEATTAPATTQAPPDTQTPTVPTGLKATVVDSSHINLAWTASTDNVGVTAYKIYSGDNLVATLGNVTSTSRTNIPSTTYTYTVSACDAAGNCSAKSASDTVTTPAASDTQTPTVPIGVKATVISSSQINLSWNASSDNVGVTAYKVYSSDGQTATLGNLTSYSHTGLRTSTAYSYSIEACDASGNCSAKSSPISATTDQLGIQTTLKAGWNLMGWTTMQGYYQGTTPLSTEQASSATMSSNTISTVFSTLGLSSTESFVIVGPEGVVYMPGSPFNTLKKALPGKAYWIYIPSDTTITVPGSTLLPTDQLSLNSGWTQIAYWGTDGVAPATGFNCIDGKYDILVDETGKVYMSGSPFNTLNTLQKNKGYFIHTTAPATLTYQCQ
jgi:subtilisin family serine protease